MSDSIMSFPRDGRTAFNSQQWTSKKKAQEIRAFNVFADPHEVPLRIGIVGAHGTGKTTLTRMLANELEIPRIDEIARTVLELGFPLNKEAPLAAQTLIWLGQFYEELMVDDFVSDRTLLDACAYAQYNSALSDDFRDSYFSTVMSNITYEVINRYYTVVFYTPIEFTMEEDGVRDPDTQYQIDIDEKIRQLLTDFNVDYITLTGTKKQRMKIAMDYLEESCMLCGRWDDDEDEEEDIEEDD